MERKLTNIELNNLLKICSMDLAILRYMNFVKIVVPFLLLGLNLFLYNEMKLGSVWGYIFAALIISIVAIVVITYFQRNSIAVVIEDKYNCFESEIVGSRIRRGSRRAKKYYMRVYINGNIKEIEYKGNQFEDLLRRKRAIVVCYKDMFKKNKYIGFTYEELNA